MKKGYNVKLGLVPTMKGVFSKDNAIEYKLLIAEKLKQMGINFVDIDWLNEEGMLYNIVDVDTIIDRFKDVDAIFCPHCNFGTEDVVGVLARKIGKPLLLWGPRDETPSPDGSRLRDTQCGLFATSKVLNRLNVPFSYLENSRIDTPVFERGINEFVAAACVVKEFKEMRIGQIGTRPKPFWTVISNEGELLEKFGIQVEPLTIWEIVSQMNEVLKKKDERIMVLVESYKQRICNTTDDDSLTKMAALQCAIQDWAEEEKLSAVAIQCWHTLQQATGLMPCFVNSELTGDGIPIACETDICGAITQVMLQAANSGRSPVFFADLTIRHPENDNAELLWHCGPFPYSLKKQDSEATISKHYLIDSKCPGVAEWEIRGGEITIARFDGDKGKYLLLAATGKGIDGPFTRGTYVWVEFKDWPELERKFIYGPYIHHVAGVHGDVRAILKESIRYIPELEPDIYT